LNAAGQCAPSPSPSISPSVMADDQPDCVYLAQDNQPCRADISAPMQRARSTRAALSRTAESFSPPVAGGQPWDPFILRPTPTTTRCA
jgi:hypothetical protein